MIYGTQQKSLLQGYHQPYKRKNEGVSKFRYILFSYPSVKNAYNETKPRLSQAKALPYHKNFVSF